MARETAEQGVILDRAGVAALLDMEFPQLNRDGESFVLEAVGPLTARMRLRYHEKHLRPGGTLSGPAMFALADVCFYAAVLANIGPQPLAVTTNFNINFLRKPGQCDLVAECRLMKLGQRLAVGEVSLSSQGQTGLVAHATGTYSIPPRPNFEVK